MELVALLVIAMGAASAFLLMLAGLLEAPWPILLGGLLLALYGLQRVSNQNQVLTDLPDPTPILQKSVSSPVGGRSNPSNRAQAATPQGLAQASEPKVSSPPTFLEGTYRGHRWRRPVAAPAQTTAALPELTYRGQKIKPPESNQS